MTQLISRFTMRRTKYLFTDKAFGDAVFLYKDIFGKKFMAAYPFYFFSFRVKYKEVRND
jgi:hypothetical protein